MFQFALFVRDSISESLSDFLLMSQTPVEARWSLRSIDLRAITLHLSFVNLRMPQNAALVPLISEPIRVNVFSFLIHKRGNSQYPEQLLYCVSYWFKFFISFKSEVNDSIMGYEMFTILKWHGKHSLNLATGVRIFSACTLKSKILDE